MESPLFIVKAGENIRDHIGAPGDESAWLALMMDAVPVVVAYLDRNCIYRFTNKVFERWFGISPDEVVGKTPEDLLGPAAWEKIRPRIMRALAGEHVAYEEEMIYADGSMRWVSAVYTPDIKADGTVAGLIALVTDISEQRKAETALRREHAFFTALLQTTAALVVVLDPSGRIIHFNRAFEEATGYSFQEVAGKNYFEIFLPLEETGRVRKAFDRVLEMTPNVTRHVNFINSRLGGKRLVDWSNSVLSTNGRTVEYVIGTGVDITDRRELEQQIISISDLERQRIGHDLHDGLGQKLTALELFVYSMKDEVRHLAPQLAERCDELSRELRETARQARTLSHGLAPVPFTADGLLLALEELAESTSAMTQVRCRFEHDTEVKVENASVAMHLYRIAQEAVNNALKHARPNEIEIRLELLEGDYQLSIRDDGAGLFTPTENGRSGMGMKLMLYRAELMGARLEVRSAPGSGTSVICKLRAPQ